MLLQDEGIGIHIVEQLQQHYVLPKGVQALDGGTMGLDLLPYLEAVDRLLILDAVDSGQLPGTTVRMVGDAIPAILQHKLSPHHVSMTDLLAAARLRGHLPATITLIGIEPYTLEPGMHLSPAMYEHVPALIQIVLDELNGWGLELLPRQVIPGDE